MRLPLLLAGPALALSACQTIGDAADSVGRHLPTVGEPCEHWQCMTESGRARSEANRQARLNPKPQPGAKGGTPPPVPPPSPPEEEEDAR